MLNKLTRTTPKTCFETKTEPDAIAVLKRLFGFSDVTLYTIVTK